MKKLMKIAALVAGLLAPAQLASAGTLIVNGQKVAVDFAELCRLAKSGQMTVFLAGVTFDLGISADSHLVVGDLVLQKSCKGKKPTHSSSGGGDIAVAADATPVTETPPADGDATATPTPAPVETPKPAAEGKPATEKGKEQPTQGGDVEGFEADNSPVSDAPAPADG